MAPKINKDSSRKEDDSRLFSYNTVTPSISDQKDELKDETSGETILRTSEQQSQRSSGSQRRLYAFDDIAALNKGVTPAMATKDDFFLVYKTSDNKVQYICDKKDLLLPWAQIITARFKTVARLDSVLGTEKDLIPLTEESVKKTEVEIIDAVPDSLSKESTVDILAVKYSYSEQSTATVKQYDTDIAEQKDTCETKTVPDTGMCEDHRESLESKYSTETASSSKSTRENDQKGITKKYEVRALEPNVDADNFGKTKEFGPKYRSASAADTEEFKEQKKDMTMEDLRVISGLKGHQKAKSFVTDTKHIKWSRTDLVDYRVSTWF